MKVLITGATGQLGQSILKIKSQFPALEIIAFSRKDMDLSKLETLNKVLDLCQPEAIINAAAYTAVDKAEAEPSLADLINHQAVKIIGQWCQKNNASLIHVSTDYVFDGKSETPYMEKDKSNPMNVYGVTKWKGEQALLELGIKNSAIVRTSWVWSEFGNNFVKTMLRLMKERKEINVVNDQFGSPTYAGDLAHVLLKMIGQLHDDQAEIYHFSNEGICTWFDFAKAIGDEINTNCSINPIATHEYPTPAKRVKYSALNCQKIIKRFEIDLQTWRSRLRESITLLN